MNEWIDHAAEEDQRREAELEEFNRKIEPFLKTLAKQICDVKDRYIQHRPDIEITVKEAAPRGILVIRRPHGQIVHLRVIPESRVLQYGVLTNGELEKPVDVLLKLDEAGKIALVHGDVDSLLQEFLKPILIANP